MIDMTLTLVEIARRQELTNKMNFGTLTHSEAEELRSILEHERKEAINTGDMIALIIIVLLMAALFEFLSRK